MTTQSGFLSINTLVITHYSKYVTCKNKIISMKELFDPN